MTAPAALVGLRILCVLLLLRCVLISHCTVKATAAAAHEMHVRVRHEARAQNRCCCCLDASESALCCCDGGVDVSLGVLQSSEAGLELAGCEVHALLQHSPVELGELGGVGLL